MVAVFIDNTRPATTQKIITPPRKSPTSGSKAWVYQAINVGVRGDRLGAQHPAGPSGSST